MREDGGYYRTGWGPDSEKENSGTPFECLRPHGTLLDEPSLSSDDLRMDPSSLSSDDDVFNFLRSFDTVGGFSSSDD
ncbi:uncharacterized protein HKW66_Vig0069870 [Vigna angularis]|uniref:Uncharacterized protein n=1 Tax=Phaseolus angularis TaxID=3914 RepID=A0A8T0K793_PHAAN|nr:uncharacterized protein HKW66_Vig0069870 [Vigna angularis]